MTSSSRKKNPRRPLSPLELGKVGSNFPENAKTQAATNAGSTSELVDEGMKELLEQFEALLREEPAFDQATREALGTQLKDGMLAASIAEGGLPEGLLDKSSWNDAVESLQQMGAISADEADHVARQLTEALAPLDRHESKLALEFSRRLSSEGEGSAIDWLKRSYVPASQEDSRNATSESPDAPSPSHRSSISSETTKSRSRRLRGPPVG